MSKNKNYDSDFCGSLPLNRINHIQPHGVLLVVEKKSLILLQVSENVENLLKKPAQEVVGTKLNDYMQRDDAERFLTKFSSELEEKVPFTFSLKQSGNEVLALVHIKPEYIILEIETINTKKKSLFIDVFQEVKYVVAEIEAAGTAGQACDIAAAQLKKLSGFDKVMIYSFDSSWNGTVIAEAMEEGMSSYLGLKFPASDVPKQARALYLKNPYRLIPDRQYVPVKLYPVINSATNSFVDLSDCNLRSVASVHLEYLKNMDVMASMSTRIVVKDALWGLIACHHREAKYLDYELCSVFELLSNVISAKLSSVSHQDELAYITSLQSKRSQITDRIYSEKNLRKGLFDNDINVLDLFNATGAALISANNIERIGNTPQAGEIENLALWLENKAGNKVLSAVRLSNIFDEAAAYPDKASGILAIPINSDKGEFLMMFRGEVVQTVNWGGNPDEAINFEPNSKNYHPRSSFGKWKEVVKNTSHEWTEQELAVAEGLRSFIFEFKTRYN